MTVSGDRIVELLHGAGTLPGTAEPQAVEAYERFIRGRFLQSVAHLLEEPLTMNIIIEAKDAYMRGNLELETGPESRRSEEQIERLKERGPRAVSELSGMMTMLNGLIGEAGLGDEMVFGMMFSERTMEEYRAGRLTLGKLLETEPQSILEGPMP